MGELIDFSAQKVYRAEVPEGILLERTDKFWEGLRTASDFMQTLPITSEQNDKLNQFLIEILHEASIGAFIQGYELCRIIEVEQ